MNNKVFGIGLNKTGTTTLASCLIELGYRHMSVRRDLLVGWFNGNLEPLFQVCDEYDSFEDWPYPLAYKELFYRYVLDWIVNNNLNILQKNNESSN